jgi:hypothetical protein
MACLDVANDSLGYSCEAESRPCELSLLVIHHTKSFCVAAWQEKGGSQCSKMSLFWSSPRWRLRFCGGVADLRFVGGVDRA